MVPSLALNGEFAVSINGKTWKATIEQLVDLAGGLQSLSYDPETGTLSISGANHVTISPTASPRINTTSASASYTLPAGVWLEGFAIKSSVNGIVSLSLVSGSADQMDGETVTAGVWNKFNIEIFNGDADTIIYFEDLTGTVTIQLKLAR